MPIVLKKVEKFESLNFRRNPIKPRIVAATSIGVIYSAGQGDAGFLAVPLSQTFEPPTSEAEIFPPTSKKDFFNNICHMQTL